VLILYSVDTSFERRPIANWLIFALLVLVFVVQTVTLRRTVEQEKRIQRNQMAGRGEEINAEKLEKAAKEEAEKKWVMRRFVLDGWKFLGIVGHNWLHLSIWLLIFNLVFLWPFGNAVCAQIGNWAYLAIFLVVSLLGGIVHLLIGSEPASGVGAALSCIAGMYLVFFPEIPMNCLFFFPRPETVGLSTYFIVPFWFLADLILAVVELKGVTYLSHFLGFLVGVSIAVVALKNRWVEMAKGERSLIDVLEKRKIEVEEAIKETSEGIGEEKKEVLLERPAESAVLEALPGAKKIEPKKAAGPGENREEEFIRFYCVCGQRIKVPKGYTGKAGRCPKCKSLVRIP
jgi:membrane associated rhomboid family serine protease